METASASGISCGSRRPDCEPARPPGAGEAARHHHRPGPERGREPRRARRRIQAASTASCAYELIFVDDGSTDDSWEVIPGSPRRGPAREGRAPPRRTSARRSRSRPASSRARGEIVRHDGRRSPGRSRRSARLPRQDRGGPRRRRGLEGRAPRPGEPASPLAHLQRHRAPGDRREAPRHELRLQGLPARGDRPSPIYGDLFRFIPALAAWQGFRVTEVPVKHHARKYGNSRYGLERILRGFFDLLSVLFLTRYSKKPMHLFGLIGLLLGGLGFVIERYLTVLWFARPQDRRSPAAAPRRR